MDGMENRGPGRPRVTDGRDKTKCFRMNEETAMELNALTEYYGKKEGKNKLSIGRTIEYLIREKYNDVIFRKSYDD